MIRLFLAVTALLYHLSYILRLKSESKAVLCKVKSHVMLVGLAQTRDHERGGLPSGDWRLAIGIIASQGQPRGSGFSIAIDLIRRLSTAVEQSLRTGCPLSSNQTTTQEQKWPDVAVNPLIAICGLWNFGIVELSIAETYN